jgi:hypothetical protein
LVCVKKFSNRFFTPEKDPSAKISNYGKQNFDFTDQKCLADHLEPKGRALDPWSLMPDQKLAIVLLGISAVI